MLSLFRILYQVDSLSLPLLFGLVGIYPDKEFQIMIVKLIQNLEIKMESQINSLEARIEKTQERFNKDLEEIKKSQYIMNNAISEIKNTLEATNSRITET